MSDKPVDKLPLAQLCQLDRIRELKRKYRFIRGVSSKQSKTFEALAPRRKVRKDKYASGLRPTGFSFSSSRELKQDGA